MKVREVKKLAKEWVLEHGILEPGYAGAYLVGGLNTFPDEAEYPLYRDVDIVLTIDDPDGTRLPQGRNVFKRNQEFFYKGLLLEIGFRDFAGFRDVEAILSNPGRAPNLAVNSLLTDPTGVLSQSHRRVAQAYARRKWVQIRLAIAKGDTLDTLAELDSLLNAGETPDPSYFGSVAHRLSGTLAVAHLQFPTSRRCLVVMKELLSQADRLALHERILQWLGYANLSREQVEAYLADAASAFDLAVAVKPSDASGSFKLHRHLRPYFVQGAGEMIEEGHHREAMLWIDICFRVAASGIENHAVEAEREQFREKLHHLRATLGFDDPDECQRRIEQAKAVVQEVFVLVDEVVATHPDISD
jgi:hypothetical protein